MKITFKQIQILRFVVFSCVLLVSICALSLRASSESGSDGENSKKLGGYFSFGILGDFGLRGYDSAFVEREPRFSYQVEIGNGYFAIPISFSSGQSVQIYGIKPRAQFLIPLVENLFMAGPGLGLVYNYWHSDFDHTGGRVSTNISEFGTQVSLQVMIRPTSLIHILITPAAYDFNVWRYGKVGRSVSGRGNFSTTDSSLGIVYSAGLAVGLAF